MAPAHLIPNAVQQLPTMTTADWLVPSSEVITSCKLTHHTWMAVVVWFSWGCGGHKVAAL